VNLTIQQWSPLFDSFIVSASAQEAPDILAMHPQEMAQFIVLGLLDPVDEIVANSEIINPDVYVERAWELQFYEGAMYALPLDFATHGVFYNADMFEAAGIEDLPTTGEEFVEAARLLTLDENGLNPGDEGFDPENVVQYGTNMHTNHHAFFQWWALYNQQGGELISADGTECVMDIDAASAAWQWLQDLVYVHGVAPQGQTDYSRDFFDGRTAMLIDGPWQMPALERLEAEVGFNWGSFRYPVVFDEFAVWGSGHNFTLPTFADPEKRDEAIAFLEWLAGNSEAWVASGQMPVVVDIIESEEFTALPGRQPFMDSLVGQSLLPNTPRYSQIFASNAPTPMMIMAQNIMLEQADVTAEVQTACDTITGILIVP
ncbi:MAG: extracellular solute-binding protein, partial [Chloroflexi bacterium]|nr:extracellular solute-binding protein [Chloroflexota bacterium]